MDHLDELESKSIYIIREAYNHFGKLAALWSAGKDSVLGDSKLYYKIDGSLHYSTIENLFKKVTPQNKYSVNSKKYIEPKENVEVLSLSSKKIKETKVVWKPVNILIKHRTEKDIFEFECSTRLSIKTTKDHSLITPISDYVNLKEAECEKIEEGDSLTGINDLNFDVSDLKEKNGVKISDNLLILAGLWLADGCYATNRKLIISSGNNDEVIDFLSSLEREQTYEEKIYEDLMEEYGKIPENIPMSEARKISEKYSVSFWSVYNAKKRKEYLREKIKEKTVRPLVKENGDVWVHSKAHAERLRKLGFVYDNEGKKKFPHWLLLASKRQIGLFLAGFVQGDGSCPNNEEITIYNTNLDIIKNVRVLLRRLGIQHGLSRRSASSSGFQNNTKYMYSLHVRSAQGKERFLEEVPPIFSKWENLKINENRRSKYPISSRKIKNKRKLNKEERTVYDLDVEDTDIFIANGLACHNSTTLAWLCKKAFFGDTPFPMVYLDTGYHFKEMYDFRDRIAEKWDLDLKIVKNEKADELGVTPDQKEKCCNLRKTQALKNTLENQGFDALLVGIRRDESGIRAKERFYSPRDEQFQWDYEDQPPEMWDQYKIKKGEEEHLRVHPLLQWTELDVWRYIKREDLSVNPLYFAKDGERYRCFSEDTRILTSEGLKGIDEITKEHEVATLDENGELQFERPKNIFRYEYDGSLFHIKNASIDLLVTPNHKLYYRRRYRNRSRKRKERMEKVERDRERYGSAFRMRDGGSTHQEIADRVGVSRPTITRWLNKTIKPRYMSISTEDSFKLERTDNVFDKLKPASIEFKRDCEWSGKEKEKFKVPDKFLSSDENSSEGEYKHKFKLESFLKVLGWFLSEGYSRRSRRIIICQNEDGYYDEIYEDIKDLGLTPSKNKEKISVSNPPLAKYFQQLGTSREKYIPKWIKKLDKSLLQHLLETMMKGDGSFNEDGSFEKYTTASWKLANDVLEIGLKLGYPVNLSKDRETWVIHFSRKNFSTPRLSKEPEIINYEGGVWDVEVDNHVIMCERNGKMCWTGNSLGCKPCTTPIKSDIKSVDGMIQEIQSSEKGERSGRSQDKEKIMQKLRALGYLILGGLAFIFSLSGAP